MVRTTIGLVVLVLFASRAAGAQTTNADGVRAFVHGDYATAARILQDAETAQPPDPAALFFLAALYESGNAVPSSILRACGLYLRAASMPGPLQALSLSKARSIHNDYPPMERKCAEASAEPWVDPPASSFTLGADHWVRIDRGGFVVGYQGSSKRTAVELGGVGWVFLPTRYTAVETPRPQPGRRHFIEFFTWIPTDDTRSSWTLVWFIDEIVGADTIWMSAEGIATADRPSMSIDVNALAHIRVNADGEAEWAVSGAHPRAGVIRPKQVR